ncbi:hypothetical protein B0H14DRAFT_3602421 [Mycena olivaceomarginata]|nr:hypothetical protein B0H14DRAFT_3602421 [Mycena olivaceomarginata]
MAGRGSSLAASTKMASTPPVLQSIASSTPPRDSSPPHSTMSHTGPSVLPECTPSPFNASTMFYFPLSTRLEPPFMGAPPPPSDEEGTMQHPPPINVWASVQSRRWDIRGIDSDFKYRVWFTQHLIQSGGAVWRGAEFWIPVSKADPNEDIWFWEDEDEEHIEAFMDDHPDHLVLEISEEEWSNACLALEARDLSHLTPEVRLRFMAWLVAAINLKAYRFRRPSLRALLQWWRFSILEYQLIDCCGICGVSGAHLDLWVETMLHVYSVDDLQSILWDRGCGCFYSRLAAHSGEFRAREVRLERDSVALRVLLELVVPLWPLILWVVFRRTAVENQTQSVEAFLDILRGPNHDLFACDCTDEWDDLSLVPSNDSQIGLYPRGWIRYMVEIDCKTWMEIRNTTSTIGQLQSGLDDLRIRLATASLLFSATTSPPQSILAPLHVTRGDFPFTIMADVVNRKRPESPSSRDVDSQEFWAASNLEEWLLWKGQVLCETVWQSTSHMTTLERIQFMHLLLSNHGQNYLPMQKFWYGLKESGHCDIDGG